MRRQAKASFAASVSGMGKGGVPESWRRLRLLALACLALATSMIFVSSAQALEVGAETTGSPQRTQTSIRFDSRVSVVGNPTTYHFEYGTEGPCDSNPCTATETHSVGPASEVVLVSQLVTGLTPNTTYDYRVVADDGSAGSPAFGANMTATTFGDEPLSHGRFPGPPKSDRAWEQVNMPDTGGNPVGGLGASTVGVRFSRDGSRAVFSVVGGTPTSQTGSLLSLFFSERDASGWHVKQITPQRKEIKGGDWQRIAETPDFSTIAADNTDYTTGEASVWHLSPSAAPVKLFERVPPQQYREVVGLSEDGSRIVTAVRGEVDPAFPGVTRVNLYDVTSGTPHLASVLPNGSACVGTYGEDGMSTEGNTFPPQSTNWISTDGSRMFFYCNSWLYMRDFGTESTKLLTGECTEQRPTFIQSIPGKAFFTTRSALSSDDTADPTTHCGNSDIYRFDFADESFTCVTCAIAGNVEVGLYNIENRAWGASVSADGSHINFTNEGALVPGAAEFGLYSLDVASGDATYVEAAAGMQSFEATPDGSTIIFDSSGSWLNATGGQNNGGGTQIYRYDDRDRSLVCLSCPLDGSLPVGEVIPGPHFFGREAPLVSDDGSMVGFVTPTPLAGADQNTASSTQSSAAGDDVYEWRNGRLLLVTDGLTNWATTESGESQPPKMGGLSASGRDFFFTAPAQYTPDALDGYRRLYDARIGGGIEFPQPPKPCPLEVCQGIPKGAPEEQAPGTENFAGAASAKKAAAKKRHAKKHKKKHKKHSRHNRSSHNRRTAR